ncbi:MAG: nitrate- and nitrite sensing domain-containing protein, partial [Burkholderiaceae bacterium]|nr:nitrate- and nitrite sensing domain-containing protein [Burkholderiaceae bacterium]
KAQRFADVRRKIINEVQPLEAQLRKEIALHVEPEQGATAKAVSLMAWALWGLDALPALRSQIDRQAMTPHDAVAAFSHLIAGLIELVFHVADAAAVPRVSRLLTALLHLVQAQEEAGQERAVGALLYASGQGSDAHQQRVLHLIDAQERSLRVFVELADPVLRGRWESLQLAPGMAHLERLRRTLCVARPGTPLDSNLSDVWFDVCTARIHALWQIQVELVQRLREDCAALILEAQQGLQDSKGLLRSLRDNPPQRAHAVDRFFDVAISPTAVEEQVDRAHSGESPSLLELLQAQSARMASMEVELDAARRTLNERKVIERAKGVLMARLGMNEEVAFRVLQKTSMDQNRRLLDVAEATLSLPDLAFAHAMTATRKPGE